MDAERLVEVRDLRVHFPFEGEVIRAVDGVSWHIDRGETVSLVGESGSGKSVSAMALMRLTDTTGGRIVTGELGFRRRDGTVIDVVEQSVAAMREIRGNEISMIFQEPMTSLNPVMTIGNQISEAIMLHQGKTRREALGLALEMLELVRIPDPSGQLGHYPHQLSGGMRQRAMIAMALSCRPALLIADEPTTALDVTIQAQILDVVKLLQREIGMSVLFITHDMAVVAEVADRVVVMLDGNVVEQGPVHDIFANPRHAYTRALLDAVPRLGSMSGRANPAKFPNVDLARAEGEAVTERRADDRTLEVIGTVRDDEEPYLEVRKLTTRFVMRGGLLRRPRGRVHAVENVSFVLHGGETLALVGESGCGKSTTGRSILRLVEPTRGSIRFRGEEIVGRERTALTTLRRHMQMIFQDPFASLNPRMTAGWLIAEPLRIHGIATGEEAEHRVAELLRRVGLEPELAGRYPHEFSGGSAPADLHRAGARAQSGAHHRRRGGVRARRIHPGPDHQPDDGSADRVRALVSLHLARPRGGRAHQPPRGGHVPRRDRGDRPARGGVRQSPPLVHQEAHGGRPGRRSAPAQDRAPAHDGRDSLGAHAHGLPAAAAPLRGGRPRTLGDDGLSARVRRTDRRGRARPLRRPLGAQARKACPELP